MYNTEFCVCYLKILMKNYKKKNQRQKYNCLFRQNKKEIIKMIKKINVEHYKF